MAIGMSQNQPHWDENTGRLAQTGALSSGTGSPWASAPTPEHLEQIAKARLLGKKVRRAQSVANFSAWTTAIFATASIVFSLTSLWGMVLGIGMAIVSFYEFRGAGELRRLDVTAPKRLAINQAAFGIMLFAYGAVCLVTNLNTPSDLQAQIGNDPQIQQMLGDVTGMYKTITIAIYASIMFAAILGPGLTAVYYYTRKKYIEEYVKQTPQWILDLQRAGMSV
jgi:hypothetical protein